MKEEDLSQALRNAIARSSPPPSMDPARALEQGRRARKRRTVAWAGIAVVPLVLGIGAGPAVVAQVGGQSAEPMVAGGGSTSPTVPPTTRKTGDPWPEGQVDRTASVGPRADRAVTLMNNLSSVVPPGFGTPDLKYPDGRLMRWPQAQYASNDGERDYWEYMATIPVEKANRLGQLLVQSTTPDGKPATDPCKLAQQFWGGTGTCAVLNAGGKKVGVVTTNGRDRYDQWATYRHDDGTVVVLAQSKKTDHPDHSPLKQPVFTNQQLAELATSPKFKISS